MRRDTRQDVGLVLLLAVAVVLTARPGPGDDLTGPQLLLSLLTLVPTVARRSRPLAVTLSVAALVAVEAVVAGPVHGVGGYAAAVLAAFTVAARCRLRTALGALAALLALLVVAHVADATGWLGDLDEVVGVTVGFWAAGRVVRSRQDLVDRLSQQAGERYRRRSAEAQVVAAEDDRRDARMAHAALATLVAEMVAEAERGSSAAARPDAAAHRSLARVRRTGAEALVQVGRLEELLEASPGASGRRRPGLPAPRLRDSPRLADQLRAAGLDVDVRVDADTLEVPADVDMTAYLVLQEALVGSLQRAGRGRVLAHVGLRHGEVVVDVEEIDPDPGGPDALAEPFGLEQTRSQVVLRGGMVESGRLDDAVRVVARIPVRHPS